MKNNNILKQLVFNVLKESNLDIPKVRLAKMTYFTYKYLVSINKYKLDQLKFIRMPLGPVPVGFMDLAKDDIFSVRESTTGLIYNRQLFSLKNKNISSLEYNFDLSRFIKKLENYPTNKLVELSHQDISWKNHNNGDEYFITDNDVAKSTPNRRKKVIKTKIDDQLIQANLVEGMKNDAIEDSTYLEYPNFKNI